MRGITRLNGCADHTLDVGHHVPAEWNHVAIRPANVPDAVRTHERRDVVALRGVTGDEPDAVVRATARVGDRGTRYCHHCGDRKRGRGYKFLHSPTLLRALR